MLARLDLGIGVKLEAPQLSLAAAAAALDYGEPRRGGDLIEQIASLLVRRLWQHRQGRPRRRRRGHAAGEPIGADDLAHPVAGVRPVNGELSRSERTEALDQVLHHRRVVRIAAAVPAPRCEPPKWLIDARDPGFLDATGVAHETARE